jgi:hypothetical protein
LTHGKIDGNEKLPEINQAAGCGDLMIELKIKPSPNYSSLHFLREFWKAASSFIPRANAGL